MKFSMLPLLVEIPGPVIAIADDCGIYIIEMV